MARVLVVGPTSEPWVAIAAEVDEDLARLRRPDVELTYRCTGAGPASIRSEDDVAAAAPFVVQAVIDAAAEGFDAVIVDCTSDPGVDAARRAVAIPVIGPGEAMRDAIDRAHPPVCVLSGDDLRSLDATALSERTADAGSVAFGGTGFSHVAERLRAERPDRPVLDPLHVALDAAVAELAAREHRFTATDYLELSRLVIEHWSSALDRDWSVGAGEVEWSCWKTAEHVVDCEFSYALFLASRCEADYPKFGELDALPDAQPSDLVDGLRAVTTMLHAVIVTAEPGARAIIRRRPVPTTGSAEDFAARGAHEMVLHAHDIAAGLGVPFEPPADLARRLLWSTLEWPVFDRIEPSGDSWSDLLERSGRARISR